MDSTKSNKKWVVFIIALITAVVGGVMMLMPAPLITTMMTDSGFTVGQGGTLASILNLLIGIFVFVAAPFYEKLGVKKTVCLALLLETIGGLIPFIAGDSYPLHLVGRVIFGMGLGLAFNSVPMVIATWFDPKTQSSLQGVRMAVSYGGFALTYYIVLAVYNRIGSWQTTMGVFGITVGICLLLWLFFCTDAPAPETPAASADTKDAAPPQKEESGLLQAIKNPQIWLIFIGTFCVIWVFNTLNTFTATYLELERGMSTTTASGYTGLMMIGGIFGGLACGFLGTAFGRRKIFGWPFCLLIILGTVMTIFGSGAIIPIGIFIIGFCASGYTMLYSVMPAEMGKSPAFYGGAMAMLIGFSYIPGYFVATVFQALVNRGITMQNVILYTVVILMVIACIPLFIVKETGPGRAKK